MSNSRSKEQQHNSNKDLAKQTTQTTPSTQTTQTTNTKELPKPLPNPLVIKNYLELYRLEVLFEQTTTSKIATYLESFTSKDLTKIVSDLWVIVENCNDVKDWFNLILKFRRQAELAQSQKNTSGDSRLRRNLHAIASYITSVLQTHHTEYFNNRKQELINQIEPLENEKTRLRHEARGIGVDAIRKQIADLILELAYLGDADYFEKAAESGLLTNFNVNPDFNEIKNYDNGKSIDCSKNVIYCAPLLLQNHYYIWLYTYKYQERLSISISEFINDVNRSQETINDKLANLEPTSVTSAISSLIWKSAPKPGEHQPNQVQSNDSSNTLNNNKQ